jgi:hypothetical protein
MSTKDVAEWNAQRITASPNPAGDEDCGHPLALPCSIIGGCAKHRNHMASRATMLKDLSDDKVGGEPQVLRPDVEKVPAPTLDKTWLVVHNVDSLSEYHDEGASCCQEYI